MKQTINSSVIVARHPNFDADFDSHAEVSENVNVGSL